MNANRKLVAVIFFALFLQVSAAGISPAIGSSFLGAYTLIEINGHQLPASTWTKVANEQNCRTEIFSGSLLLGSHGEWAGLVEEREICIGSGGSTNTGAPSWGLLTGSYEISGDQIRILFLGSVMSGKIPTAGNELILHEAGVGQFAGQSLDYIFRRK